VRIIRLQGSNVKKIKVIDITPNKYVNRISGGNGTGKTTTLDMIEMVLVGGKSIPSRPVRTGAARGGIKIDMGEDSKTEVVLTRQFFEGSSKRAGRLHVEQMPGADATELQERRQKITTPDELEDALLKQVSFDPLEFMRMKPKEQYHILRRISTPDIDMDALDEKIQGEFDARTIAGRKRDQLEAQRDAIQIPEGLPTEPRDVKGMTEELAQVSNYNLEIERERREREDYQREYERMKEATRSRADRLGELRLEIERMEIALRQDLDRLVEMEKTEKAWEPLAEPKDAAALAAQIEEARILNRAIERGQMRAKIDADYKVAHEEWSKLDAAVKEGERRKKEAIAHAKYPVEGLGFGNQEVMYNNLPFEQASNAEQIKVSAAIGMTTNRKVRVMRIKDGSLLDDASLAIIADMAHERDFQVFIECVDLTGNVGFYMEDGEVKTVNDEPLDRLPEAKTAKKATKKKVSK
jgi:DNA repair exonuclease SbcCD ATPase subunit